MQMALRDYRSRGGLNEEGTAIKDEHGNFIVRPDPSANKFAVDRSPFRRRIEGKIQQEKRGRLPKLNQDDEKFLLDLIALRALIGRPMGKLDLRTTARKLMIARHEDDLEVKLLSTGWANGFMNRYQAEIGIKVGQILNKPRVKAMTREKLDDFYDLLEYIVKKTDLIQPQDLPKLAKVIFNCDETGISLKPNQVKFIKIGRAHV